MNKIEKIVSHYIKKFISEGILDSLIEEKISNKLILLESIKASKVRLNENFTQEEEEVPRQRSKITAEMLGMTDSVWRSAYEDTANRGHSVVLEQNSGPVYMEHVSEGDLKKLGLKNYSGISNSSKNNNTNITKQDQDLEMKRREILRKVYGQS